MEEIMAELWTVIDDLVNQLSVNIPDDKSLAEAFKTYANAYSEHKKKYVGLTPQDRHAYSLAQVHKYYNKKDKRWI
jgi:hypothetical protein